MGGEMNNSGPGRYGDSKSRAGVDDLFLLHLKGTFVCRLPFLSHYCPKNKFQDISSVELSYNSNIFHLAYSKFKVLHKIHT